MGVLKKLVLVLTLFVVGFVVFRLLTVGEPEIVGEESLAKLGARSEVRLVVKGPEGISAVRVEIGQDGNWQPLIEDTGHERTKELTFVVEPGQLGLHDGDATVRIQAEGAWFRSATTVVDAVVDTVPPGLSVVAVTPWVKEGGSGAARFKAEDASSVAVEDDKGNRVFARRVGETSDGEWVGLFAVGLGEKTGKNFFGIGRDDSGNETRISLPVSVRAEKFPVQTIHLSEAFIRDKVRPMLGAEGDSLDLVEVFRHVNERWRAEDEATFRALGNRPPTGLLWDGKAFSQLKNAQAMARFGDFRRYYFENKEISTSLHLGYDLASVRHAEVPAAASGTVVFAGALRIYGNTVVLDHGLGLMSIYSHLSAFLVREGDVVLRGVPVARTGSTGFAFGDHLHCGVLVGGIEVNPLEWWDEQWISRNLEEVLSPAFAVGDRDG